MPAPCQTFMHTVKGCDISISICSVDPKEPLNREALAVYVNALNAIFNEETQGQTLLVEPKQEVRITLDATQVSYAINKAVEAFQNCE